MTHNVKSKTMSLICSNSTGGRRQRQRGRMLNHRSADKLMANKVLQLLKMEATAKAAAGEAATSASPDTSAANGVSSTAAVDSGGGGTVTLDNNSEFYNTGRVGRRNALPDILNHHHSTTSTADLPDKLSALSTTDASEAGASK